MDPETDLEDELPTPVGSPSPDVDKSVPHSTSLGVDLELARAVLEVGVLPDPEVGSSMTPFPRFRSCRWWLQFPWNESLLERVLVGPSVASWFCSAGSDVAGVLRSTLDVSPPSGLAPMDQCLPWSVSLPVGETADSPLLPVPLTPRWMDEGQFVPGLVVTSLTGKTDVAGGHPSMPHMSREGSFDVHQDRSASGASPRVLDGMRGCQYRMTSYDEENGGSDFSQAYGIHSHDPRLLEYVGAPESARLLSRIPEYWLHHLGHQKTLAVALQLQHDADLILSNVQVLSNVQQFAQQDVVRGHACRLWSGAVSGGCDAAGGAVVPYSSGGALHDSHGIVAAT